jgi:class 3 adenylate cyclase
LLIHFYFLFFFLPTLLRNSQSKDAMLVVWSAKDHKQVENSSAAALPWQEQRLDHLSPLDQAVVQATHCCLGLLEMSRRQRSESSADPLSIHISIGTGNITHVYVGNLALRSEYFVCGQAVELASKLLGMSSSGPFFPLPLLNARN